MDDYFLSGEGETIILPQVSHQTPSYQSEEPKEFYFSENSSQLPTVNYSAYDAVYHSNNNEDDDFHEAEEDEVTKRIRQSQEALQNKLRQRSQEEYELKLKRKEEGRRQLQQFNENKQKQLQRKRKDNIQSQERLIDQLKKGTSQQGWSKVAANIKIKQGQHGGKKDVSRMREAILHKKQDQRHKN